jgi:hypothetical protein
MAAFTSIALGVGAAASAAGSIIGGNAQEAAAQAQLAEQRKNRKEALKLAKPSAQELAQIKKQIEVTDRAVARQEKLLAAVDPALMEAGKQALELLKGKEAAVLDPMKRQRAEQRRMLEDRLRQQLGPGFETSSAGIEALSRFDTQTQDLLTGAQSQAVGQLLGQANATVAQSGALIQGAHAMGMPLASLNAIKSRQVTAALGSPTSQYAGADHMSEMALGQGLSGLGSGLAGLGGQMYGADKIAAALKPSGGSTGLPAPAQPFDTVQIGSSTNANYGERIGGGYQIG